MHPTSQPTSSDLPGPQARYAAAGCLALVFVSSVSLGCTGELGARALEANGGEPGVWPSTSTSAPFDRTSDTATSTGGDQSTGTGANPSGSGPAGATGSMGSCGDGAVQPQLWEECDGSAMCTRDCRLRKWGEVVALPQSIQDAQVAILAGGDVVVMGYQVGYPQSVHASHFDAFSGTWEHHDLDSAYEISRPSFGVDGSGNVIAVWVRRTPTSHVLASQYSSLSGLWSTPVQLTSVSDPYADHADPEVAVNDDGDAVAIWATRETPYVIGAGLRVSRYDALAQTWGPRTFPNESNGASQPSIAVDSQGNALAVWDRLISVGPVPSRAIRVNHYDATDGWGVPQWLQGVGQVALIRDMRVVMTDGGDAMAVWRPSGSAVVTKRYTSSTATWETQTVHNPDGYQHAQVNLAMNDQGAVVLAWVETEGELRQIHVRYFDTTSASWTPDRILDTDAQNSPFPHVAINGGGNVVVIWDQLESLMSAVYDYTTDTWDTIQIEQVSANSLAQTSLSLNDDGEAVAAWSWTDPRDYQRYIRTSMFR